MAEEIKLCIDCRHCVAETSYKLSWFKLFDIDVNHRCHHPDFMTTDYVDGKRRADSCDVVRYMDCGPEGRGWEVDAPNM